MITCLRYCRVDRLVRWVGCLIILCLATASVSGAEAVRLQLKWQHQFQFAGYYMAIEKGFYQERGLNVSLLEGDPSVDVVDAVSEGKADYGVGMPDLLLAYASGKPIVVLGAIFQHSPYAIISLRNGRINHINDLVGKKVMIESHTADLTAYLIREMVSPSQLEILPHSQNVQDLIEGKVDAMSAYVTDEVFSLKQAGVPYQVFSPSSSGIDFYGDCLFTTQDKIRHQHDQVRLFREATLLGWDYAMKHVDETIQVIHAKYSQRKSKDALFFEAEEMRKLICPELVPYGYTHLGRWEHIQKTYIELGMLKHEVKLDGFLHNPEIAYTRSHWVYILGGAVFLSALALAGFWQLSKKRGSASSVAGS